MIIIVPYGDNGLAGKWYPIYLPISWAGPPQLAAGSGIKGVDVGIIAIIRLRFSTHSRKQAFGAGIKDAIDDL